MNEQTDERQASAGQVERPVRPLEAALRRAYYYTEPEGYGEWRGPDVDEFERWHSVAKVAARDAEPLLRAALQALLHYREQTRPIADCDAVIARLQTRLGPNAEVTG